MTNIPIGDPHLIQRISDAANIYHETSDASNIYHETSDATGIIWNNVNVIPSMITSNQMSANVRMWNHDTYYYPPRNVLVGVRPTAIGIELYEDEYSDSKAGTISREELVKYLEERKLREENELVRSLWDRYQVAVKLVRSSEDDDHGTES